MNDESLDETYGCGKKWLLMNIPKKCKKWLTCPISVIPSGLIACDQEEGTASIASVAGQSKRSIKFAVATLTKMGTLMSSSKKFLVAASAVAIVMGLAQSLMADPLLITVSMTNSSFTPVASTTLDTAAFPSGSQNSAALSPGLIPVYNASYGTSLTNPFAGTGVTWSVQGQVNVPGTPDQGLLQGGTILLHNSTATTYYAQITIEGGNFTLPGSTGDKVLATASFSASSVRDGSASLYSFIDATQIGYVWYNTAQVGPDDSIIYTRGADYRLTETFDVVLNGNPTNDPLSSVNISVTTTVTPVSEPWTVVTLFAMIIPGGLMVRHFGKHNQLAFS